jgi:eukaryotic-like serine/threonine-protein kinase
VHMVRGSAGVADARIECYHDRLRDAVAGALDAGQRSELYRALAGALSCRDSPELLSRCQEAIGDRAGAAESAVHAARRAAAALAFERAIVHYRRALELGRPDAALLLQLAESLENAGYGREAAATFESLAVRAEGEMRLDYQRRAALQLLETGHLDKGLELLSAVCRSVGLDLPSSDATAFLTYQFISLQLRVSSKYDAPRLVTQPSSKQKLVLRTARAAVTGVVNHLQLIATSIAAQYLREALRSGDTGDCVRALGFQAHMTTMVEPASAQAREALDRMQQLATDSMDNELLGFASMMQGTTAYHREEMRTARDHLSRAKTWLSECRGVEWEHDATNCYDLMSASYAGDYLDMARTTPIRLDEALRRGRVWAATMLTGFAGMPAWLSADDVDGYRERLHEVHRLQEQGEHRNWQRFVLLYAEGLLHVYVGEPQRGFEHFAKGHAKYKRSLFARRTAMGALGYATHRGRCAASALQLAPSAGRGRRELLEGLSESISVLVSRGRSRSRALAALLTAARSLSSDAPERALDELQAALPLLERAGLRMHLAAARKRLGEHLGGDTGRELLMAAEDAMRAQGIRNIEAMTELNCPGLRS